MQLFYLGLIFFIQVFLNNWCFCQCCLQVIALGLGYLNSWLFEDVICFSLWNLLWWLTRIFLHPGNNQICHVSCKVSPRNVSNFQCSPLAVKSSAWAVILTLLLGKVVTIPKTINTWGITTIACISVETGSRCVFTSTEQISYPPNVNKHESSDSNCRRKQKTSGQIINMLRGNTFRFTVSEPLKRLSRVQVLSFPLQIWNILHVLLLHILGHTLHKLGVILLMRWRLIKVLTRLLSSWHVRVFHLHQLVADLDF